MLNSREHLIAILSQLPSLPMVLGTVQQLRKCVETFRQKHGVSGNILIVLDQEKNRVDKIRSYWEVPALKALL